MIKFFRNIRKKLATENRAMAYSRYAIGEIILVVIGILIALQINNWNQNRINSSKEQKHLVGLSHDLEEQIEAFDNRIKFYNEILRIGESILNDYNNHGDFTKIDNINHKLSTMLYTNNYPEIRTAFNELNSTGQLDLIKSDSLRSHIIKYYQASENANKGVDANTYEVYYKHLFPVIKSSVIVLPQNFGYDSIAFNQEQLKTSMIKTFDTKLSKPDYTFDLINAISLRIVIAKTNRDAIEAIYEDAELLLQEINDLINNQR